jgi:ectoine hydroxylase-related dioxygenase (phytanoyl-CoA dioxygenase family)
MSTKQETINSGFSIEEAVFTPFECEQVVESIVPATIRQGRAGLRHLMSQPVVSRVASDPRMLQMARFARNADAVPYRATLFDKSGAANWSVVWHQDTALPLQSRFDSIGWGPWSQKEGLIYAHAPSWALSRIVALRLHLDESTADNGPLRVVPGSHGRHKRRAGFLSGPFPTTFRLH